MASFALVLLIVVFTSVAQGGKGKCALCFLGLVQVLASVICRTECGSQQGGIRVEKLPCTVHSNDVIE